MTNKGIYKISIGKYFYIGSSSNLSNRLESHIEFLTKGHHQNNMLQSCFNLNRWRDFKIEILEYCKENITVRELLNLENKYIVEEGGYTNSYGLNQTELTTTKGNIWMGSDSTLIYPKDKYISFIKGIIKKLPSFKVSLCLIKANENSSMELSSVYGGAFFSKSWYCVENNNELYMYIDSVTKIMKGVMSRGGFGMKENIHNFNRFLILSRWVKQNDSFIKYTEEVKSRKGDIFKNVIESEQSLKKIIFVADKFNPLPSMKFGKGNTSMKNMHSVHQLLKHLSYYKLEDDFVLIFSSRRHAITFLEVMFECRIITDEDLSNYIKNIFSTSYKQKRRLECSDMYPINKNKGVES